MSSAVANAETVQVPRDLGELPVVSVDQVDARGLVRPPSDDVFLVERARPRRVEAYDLRGRQRWASLLVGTERLEATARSRDLVVIATEHHVTALDKRSGRRRWIWRPPEGSIVGDIRAHGATFVVREDLPPAEEGHWRERRAFVQLEARNGSVRWRSICPETMCTFLANAGDDLLIDVTGGFRSVTPTTGTLGPHVDVVGRPIAAGGGAVLSCVGEQRSDSDPQYGPIQLAAYSASEEGLLWRVALSPGNPQQIAVRRAGDAWVVLTEGRLDVLDAATGATRRVVRLPDVVDFDPELDAIPDGRVVGVVRPRHGRRSSLSFVLVVDPIGPRTASFWSATNQAPGWFTSLANVPLLLSSFDPRAGLRVLRATPGPAPRASRSLVAEVNERLDRLLKAPSELDLEILQRLDRSAYEAAAIARLEDASPAALERLAGLLEPPPATPAARDALGRVLVRVVAQATRTPDQFDLLDAALSLLDALPGPLPEGPMRSLSAELAKGLRQPARSGRVLTSAARYLDLLWRAPYPNLDEPMRAAVAAAGVTTTGRADCLAKPALSEEEQIWADLSWPVLGLRTEHEPALLVVPEGSQAARCVDISTLGGPVIVGTEQTLATIKAGKPWLGIRHISSFPLSPEANHALDQLDPAARAALGNAPLREAAWSFRIAPLNAGGRRAIIARVAGRWVVVKILFRWVS
jgi:hypothetical protein